MTDIGSLISRIREQAAQTKAVQEGVSAGAATGGTSPALRIRWTGAFLARHSLARVNRELVTQLARLRPDWEFHLHKHPTDDDALASDPAWQFIQGRLGQTGGLAVNGDRPDVEVRHHWPPDWSPTTAGRLVVIQPWEYGSVPRDWIDPINRNVDELWVPSQWVRDCYVAGGVEADRVWVVPNGVSDAFFQPADPYPLPTRKGYRLLYVGGTIPRKGVDVLLDAYADAFSRDDDVVLVVKDFGNNTFYRTQNFSERVQEFARDASLPELIYLDADLSEVEINALYRACDALVHPYRGEGYGLPIAEAMACGLPTVVTGYGAALDFANASNSYLIPSTLSYNTEKRIGDTLTVDYPFWAEPDVTALAETLRGLYERRDAARELGGRAAAEIRAGHTWGHAAQVAHSRLRAVTDGARKSAPPAASTIVSAFSPLGPARESLTVRKEAALDALRAGRHVEAVQMLERLIGEDPGDWPLLNAYAVALHQTGRNEQAVASLREGIRRSPDTPVLHANLVRLMANQGSIDEAYAQAIESCAHLGDTVEMHDSLSALRDAIVQEMRTARKAAPKPGGGSPGGGKARHKARSTARPSDDPRVRELTCRVAEIDALLGRRRTEARPAERNRVSLVMIVRNEERFLRGCLESVHGAVDEIVVVDTGSSDDTVRIAQEFGAKVVHHAWEDDFSAARNVSLDHASGAWALWLDADERLATGEADLLRRLVRDSASNVGGYMVNIRNYMEAGDESKICWHRACRLFRIRPEVRFTGRIHEQNMLALERAGFVCAMSQLTIDHHGYTQDVIQGRNKHERFIRMLTREVEESEGQFYHDFQVYNLANAYYAIGDMESALHWYAIAGENPDPKQEHTTGLFTAWVTALYRTGRADEALRVCERADSLGIVHPALDFARGHAHIHLLQYDEAEPWFRSAIKRGAEGMFTHSGDVGAYTHKAWYGLALTATGRDDYETTIEHCKVAIGIHPDFADARFLLGNAYRRLGQFAEAREAFEELLERHSGYDRARGDLGEVLYELGEYAAARPALQRAAANAPNNYEIWSRLADTCERLDMTVEALTAFQALQRIAPRSPEVRVNVGRMHARLGNDARAIDAFTDAIFLKPDYANAYFNAGDALYRLGYYPKAAEALCAGLEIDPDNASGFFVLGNCMAQMEQFEQAVQSYREALVRRPDYDDAAHNLEIAQEMLHRAA